jgi:hypothetical protein
MNKAQLDGITKRFILQEEKIDAMALIQKLMDALENLRPSTREDQARINNAKSSMNEIADLIKRMNVTIQNLRYELERGKTK